MKTIEYSQPDFYHFTRDSIELAITASKLYPNARCVCDYYTGNGVVGIEYSFRVEKLEEIIFVENNLKYQDHLEFNIAQLTKDYRTNIYWSNHFPAFLKKDTLVLANPPYFIENEGRLPKNLDKRNCHFLEQQAWESWLDRIRGFPHLFLARLDLAHIKKLSFNLHRELEGRVGIISLK